MWGSKACATHAANKDAFAQAIAPGHDDHPDPAVCAAVEEYDKAKRVFHDAWKAQRFADETAAEKEVKAAEKAIKAALKVYTKEQEKEGGSARVAGARRRMKARK